MFARYAAILLLGSALSPAILHAQEARTPAPASSDAAGDEQSGGDIVVTAFHRETRLQQTPAAITSLSGDNLRNANIANADDLQRLVPGLVVTNAGAGQRRLSLRGVRSAGDAQVGVYYDEASLTAPPGTTTDAGGSQSDLDFFDVSRVEVLRGPQGTLYGAGAMAGAVRIIFNKPDLNRIGASVDVSGTTTAHGGQGYQANAAINLPIVDDKLAARLVVYRRYSDGYIDNPRLNLKNVNGESTWGGRFLLRYRPVSELTIDAAAYFQDNDGGPPTWSPSLGRYQSADQALLWFKDKNRLYNVTANAELGFATLTATSSYQDRDVLMTRDPSYLFQIVGAAASTPAIYYQPQSVKNWTNEVRLQSAGSGPLHWTIGGYYEDRTSKILSEAHVVGPDGRDLNPPKVILQRHVGDSLKQKAVFGELAYTLFDRLTLTGGLRYYNYDKLVSGDTTIGFAPIGTSVRPYAEFRSSNDGWLYKFNASLKADEHLLIYAQAASGYRPGGVNQVLGLAEALPYKPDSLWTYEAGFKASYADGRVLLNVAAFRTDWKDMQVSLNSGTFAYLGNAGAARIQGFEAELGLEPIRGWTVNASLTALTAKLTQDQIVSGAVVSTSTGRTGDRIPNIPQGTVTLASQYDWAVGNGLTAVVRGDVNYVGESYSDFHQSTSFFRLGDYFIANARIGVKSDKWGAYLFASNLFDEVATTYSGTVLGGRTQVVTTVPPRTIGINLTSNF
ncbi:MAG TPA: TonB-dependent receptor [Sphingobium sp.]|uniref:TonB-dependent receptor n=1 Tax=Sphingobium sp. TaxID=1912891 RepID=UPI002ED26A82